LGAQHHPIVAMIPHQKSRAEKHSLFFCPALYCWKISTIFNAT